MSTPATPKPIHAAIGLTHQTDGVVAPILDASLQGLLANTKIYDKPPFDLNDYANAINAYKGAIPTALDGSRTAVAQKNKLRQKAITMYKLLARYVEGVCNGEMATFLLSGFKPKASPQNFTPPASEAVRKAVAGKISGTIEVTLMRVRGAKSYNLRHAPVVPGGAPGTWTIIQVPAVRPPTTITGLTPGTTYAFQAQALTNDGPGDWSDSVTIMCT
jgi:hypothetical protein